MGYISYLYDPKADFITHLKRGPVVVPRGNLEAMYLTDFSGFPQRFGGMWISATSQREGKMRVIRIGVLRLNESRTK